MLKLMLFAPCEKVIVSQDSTSSLITVLEHFTVGGEIAEKLPINAGLPFNWQVMVLWKRETEVVEPISCDAHIELVAPNGEISLFSDIIFTVTNQHTNFRNVVEFPIFPIGQKGTYKLTLKYKETTSENWEQVGEFSINVVYNIKELTDENKNETANDQPVKRVPSVSGISEKTRIRPKKRHPKKHK